MATASHSTLVSRRQKDDGRKNIAIERLSRIAQQVKHLIPSQVASEAEVAHARSFVKGVLAHLIIVPAWVAPPGALLAGLSVVGAPFGIKGVVSTLGLGAAMFAGPAKWRPVLAAVVVAMGASAKRFRTIFAAACVSFLVAVLHRKSAISPSPWMYNFVSRWAKDFYKQAVIRGALGDIRPTKSFFGYHPHGCLAAGFTINGVFSAEFSRVAGRMAWLCDDKLRHKNPGFALMAEAYLAENRRIEACDAAGFRQHMSSGSNVAFIPGGFKDAVAFEYRKDVCVLRDRKGFIKYCLQYGYRAHPVYTFGECETYHTFTGLKSLRMSIAKKNLPALAFFGWPLVPFLPLPEARILTYVGPGIDMPHIAQPSNAEVDHWHHVYMEALAKLFDDNKAEAGYAGASLEIL